MPGNLPESIRYSSIPLWKLSGDNTEAWVQRWRGLSEYCTDIIWFQGCSPMSALLSCQNASVLPWGPWGYPEKLVCGHQDTAAAKSLQSCLTLCDPIDGSPPGSPIPGILQAITLGVGCHFYKPSIGSLHRNRSGLTVRYPFLWGKGKALSQRQQKKTLTFWSKGSNEALHIHLQWLSGKRTVLSRDRAIFRTPAW